MVFKELIKTPHILQGTVPTLADGTVAGIMLNLVQSSLMKQTQFKHRNTGDVVFKFTWEAFFFF